MDDECVAEPPKKTGMVLDLPIANCPSTAAAANNEVCWVVDHKLLHDLGVELESKVLAPESLLEEKDETFQRLAKSCH